VALLHQRFGQIGHHAFRTTVQLGRNRLVQRSDLSDSHNDELLVKNQAKVLRLEKATRVLARAVWPDMPGAGLILSRNPAIDRYRSDIEPRLVRHRLSMCE
jgi:hypothetical protein